MARSLKPMKVGTVKLRGGVGEADIYLDRNDKTFFSMVGEARIAADSADECEKRTREALSAVLTLVWKQIIVIDLENRGWQAHRHSVTFTAERHEVALNPVTGKHVEREFRADDDDPQPLSWLAKESHERNAADQTRDIHEYCGATENGSYFVVVPYTKAAWATCLEIRRAIGALQQRISALIKSDELEAFLNSGGGWDRLLPAGKEEDQIDE